jgi:hypothetical protein
MSSVCPQLSPCSLPEPGPVPSSDQSCDSQDSLGLKEGWGRGELALVTRHPIRDRGDKKDRAGLFGDLLSGGGVSSVRLQSSPPSLPEPSLLLLTPML